MKSGIIGNETKKNFQRIDMKKYWKDRETSDLKWNWKKRVEKHSIMHQNRKYEAEVWINLYILEVITFCSLSTLMWALELYKRHCHYEMPKAFTTEIDFKGQQWRLLNNLNVDR